VSAWEHTNPLIGNWWRHQAKGKCVLSLPLWLYCDDTSGNQSKKWNEHNSFLFTLAGLPGSETSKEYNIHFICTSNLAPPLEMLDGVVQQIEYIFFSLCHEVVANYSSSFYRNAHKEGIVAWDCEYKEYVLIFPTVLALLGDNPMQSEMACHIGLQGKAFCRACMVKRPNLVPVNQPQDSESNSRPTTLTVPTTSTHPSRIDSEDEAGSTGHPHNSDVSDVYFTLPLVVRSDSASPVDIHRTLVICTGLRWMSGDCPVIVR